MPDKPEPERRSWVSVKNSFKQTIFKFAPALNLSGSVGSLIRFQTIVAAAFIPAVIGGVVVAGEFTSEPQAIAITENGDLTVTGNILVDTFELVEELRVEMRLQSININNLRGGVNSMRVILNAVVGTVGDLPSDADIRAIVEEAIRAVQFPPGPPQGLTPEQQAQADVIEETVDCILRQTQGERVVCTPGGPDAQ